VIVHLGEEQPAVQYDYILRRKAKDLESNRGGSARVDNVSLRIIELLQGDGRLSYATIAKEVGLSEAAVRHRVQRLIDLGVMQIVAVTDPLSLGMGRQALVGVKVSGDLVAVASEISKIKEADYVVICAGSVDIFVEIVAKDDERLLQIMNGEIRAIPGVVATEAFVYLRLAKQTYSYSSK
jgi:Lrp/AsnC family transcriptional regulator for asnA, asnC and gidA